MRSMRPAYRNMQHFNRYYKMKKRFVVYVNAIRFENLQVAKAMEEAEGDIEFEVSETSDQP